MQLTGKNTKYDALSGAFIVQQSDEMKLLMQILQRLGTIESKVDALMQHRGLDGYGAAVDKQ